MILFYADKSLFQGTIRFNILLGANRDVTQEELDNACKDANVWLTPFLANKRYSNSFRVFLQGLKRLLEQRDPRFQVVKSNALQLREL